MYDILAGINAEGRPVFRCFFLGVVSLPCRSSVDLSRFFRAFKVLLLIPKCMISPPVQPSRIDAVYRRVQVSALNVEEEARSHKFGSSCHNGTYMNAKKLNLF
jgi:hypothetical protein